MILRAKPLIFGTPLMIALGTLALMWALFGIGSGADSPLGLTWNVELTQRDAGGNVLYNEKLHNAIQDNGLEDAMLRLLDASAAGDKSGETDAYDQIVLMNTDDTASDGLLAANILLLVDGGTGNNSGQSDNGVDNNPADGAFSDGGGDGTGDGTVTLQFLAVGDAAAATQMHLVKAGVDDTTDSGAAAIASDDIAATIEIGVDLDDTDTLTVTWTVDAS